MASILPIIQIILSVALILAILLQTSASGLGGAFGGSDSPDAGYNTRRGIERILFNATIIIAVLFILSSFIAFLLQ